MGYIPSADTVYAVAYLTDTGRNYLFNKNNNRFDSDGDDLFQVIKFTLSDIDTNYLLNQTANSTERLASGDVPNITGESEGCLKTAANYTQSNLLAFVFDSTPTNVAYFTDLDTELLIAEESIPSSTESAPTINPLGPAGFTGIVQ